MKKFLALLFGALLACCFMFAGCDQTEIGDEPIDGLDPNTEVKISFMHMWSEHSAAIQSIIDGFEKKYPNITVEISITPYDQIEQVLQAAFISGKLPNVYIFYTHYMNPLVSASDGVMAGTLNNLHDEIVDSFIQPDAWEMGNINGNYYSVPFRATGELVFYNKTLFEEKGWEKPDTFEEFGQLMDKIYADGDYIPLAAGGQDDQITYLINAMSLFLSVLDGSVDEPGYQVGRLEPDEDISDAVAVYEKVRDWYKQEYFGRGAIAVSSSGAIKQFTSRNAAMVFANVNNLGDITSIMPNDQIDAFAIPAPEVISDEVKYVFGGYDGISYSPVASKDEMAASLMLIRYLVSDEVQQILADRTQSIIVNKNVEYHDATYAAFAEEYKYVGAYATGIDYMTGDHSAGNNTIMSAYIAGTSGLTAAETIKLLNDNVYMDMQDTLINDPPVDWYPRQNPKKDFDRSWLN